MFCHSLQIKILPYKYNSTLKFFNQFWDTQVGFLQNVHVKDTTNYNYYKHTWFASEPKVFKF